MSDELKKSIEKKRKIAACIGIVGLYAIIIGIGILLIALFQVSTLEKFAGDEYMQDPTIPYNERENASYILTPDNFESLINECADFIIIGVVVAGIGIAVLAVLVSVTPDKKERHKLLCETPQNLGLRLIHYPVVEHCPSCGLKLSLLDKE